MGCSFSEDQINQAIAFHRHSCPGLAIGIRVAEYALHYFPKTNPADLVCITETEMCALDGIQFFAGCSMGKGNLFIRDYGKAAFTFYDRKQNKGCRFLFTPSYPDEISTESAYLAKRKELGPLSDEDQKRSGIMRDKMKSWLMNCTLEEAFTIKEPVEPIPHRLPMAKNIICANCGEMTMENRMHTYQSEPICIPCQKRL